jgi:predicted  nucleic acid-binding Zn-ribbon protein
MNFLRQKKFYLIFIFLILIGYISFKSISSQSVEIPEEFLNSRLQSVIISEEIINLSNQIKDGVFQINQLDEQKKYKEAFNLISELNTKILEIRKKAVDLSKELEIMTKSLNDLKVKGGAEKLAVSSITNRIIIINHLINYSDYLFQLNLALENRFYGKSNKDEILNLIDKINSEVEAINKANEKAKIDMEKFDTALMK